ncbi:FG-GAP-like repeat-containing protein [Lentzea sp.]|uniref:FG-GAP-like repeat-containing protein n=1 Tax=Lentzea sp. TaxID=56099 RepID=UPI002ED68E1F
MNANLLRRAAGTSLVALALAAVAAVGPVSAAPGSSAGNPPLPSYPGLVDEGRLAAADVSTTAVPCNDNGGHKSLTRAQVLARAQSWLSVGVQYSQSRCYRNSYGDYRTDCSGFVSMAWGLGKSGSYYYTGNLGDVSTEIPRASLQPGDALLRHENNAKVDHVALFVGWDDAAHTRPVVIEQTGSADTVRRAWTQSNASNYRPVRYDRIVDGSTGGVAAGDVTGDGKADLLARRTDGSLLLYANGGTDSSPYGTGTAVGSGWQGFLWFLAGDVNGDHRADVVAAQSDGTLRQYLNTGNATAPYGTGSVIGSGWQGFTSVNLADVTGDGRADLVAVSADGVLRLYANTGSDSAPYSAGGQIGTGWGAFMKIAAGDVTGDGRADLVGVNSDGALLLYVNTGNASAPYGPVTVIGDGWKPFDRVLLGDTNGDARAEIIATQPDGSLRLYLNSGTDSSPYGTGLLIGDGWQQFA